MGGGLTSLLAVDPDRQLMRILESHPFIEEMASAWDPALGPARGAYSGHAYRVLNYARALLGTASHDEELALAAAFHDLGIWSDGTFDYLEPSERRAEEYRRDRAPGLDGELIALLIRDHHLLRSPRGGISPEVRDAFRRADLVDVSRGALRGSVSRELVRELTSRFPYRGFHGVLVRTGLRWALRHPGRPLPMVRFR